MYNCFYSHTILISSDYPILTALVTGWGLRNTKRPTRYLLQALVLTAQIINRLKLRVDDPKTRAARVILQGEPERMCFLECLACNRLPVRLSIGQ